MSNPTTRFAYDKTGVNPDNLVMSEVHTLSTNQVRACAPTYGAFFTESLQVYDHSTDRLLQYGTQYRVVELLQDATIRLGKEVCLLILIMDTNVSSQIRINYQALGGMYQNDASGILSMYETIAKDNRTVDWINVLNKPLDYPPTLHNHLFEDIYGFEPLVDAIERLRNAIIMGNVPAFEGMIDWVSQQLNNLTNVTGSQGNSLLALNIALQAEIAARMQADENIQVDIAAIQTEIDNTITVQIANLEQKMTNDLIPIVSALNTEIQTRAADDTTEKNARVAGDNNLQTQINNLSSSLATTFLPLAGGKLTGQLTCEVSAAKSSALLQKGGNVGGVYYYDNLNPVNGVYNYKLGMGDGYVKIAANTLADDTAATRTPDSGDTILLSINATTGDIVGLGNVSAYSDPRLKKDIAPINSALDICYKLSGVRFTWNGISSLTKIKEGKQDIGLLADQVKAVLPELVSESEPDSEGVVYNTVCYEKLVPVLLEAIKELSDRVRVLESEKVKVY